MNAFTELPGWLTDSVNWSGSSGIPVRVFEHIQLSLAAVFLAVLVALPLGLYIGHTRRFEYLVVTAANLGRAVPSFAIIALALPLSFQLGLGLSSWPTIAALFLLALPPIITNTYVGIKNVDSDTVEAAHGMGLSGSQVLRSVEMPLAASVIVTGIRTSAVQVVATATLGALIGGGGLGRYIVDGFAQGDDVQILGGAVLVALLAVLTEVGFGALQRFAQPRTGREGRRPERSRFEEVGQVGRPGDVGA